MRNSGTSKMTEQPERDDAARETAKADEFPLLNEFTQWWDSVSVVDHSPYEAFKAGMARSPAPAQAPGFTALWATLPQALPNLMYVANNPEDVRAMLREVCGYVYQTVWAAGVAHGRAEARDRRYAVDQYVKEWRLRFAEECATSDSIQSYDSDFLLNLMTSIHAVMDGRDGQAVRAESEDPDARA